MFFRTCATVVCIVILAFTICSQAMEGTPVNKELDNNLLYEHSHLIRIPYDIVAISNKVSKDDGIYIEVPIEADIPKTLLTALQLSDNRNITMNATEKRLLKLSNDDYGKDTVYCLRTRRLVVRLLLFADGKCIKRLEANDMEIKLITP